MQEQQEMIEVQQETISEQQDAIEEQVERVQYQNEEIQELKNQNQALIGFICKENPDEEFCNYLNEEAVGQAAAPEYQNEGGQWVRQES